jgi:NADPH:quinone reductase-like Zn-dependent oxidoreductase
MALHGRDSKGEHAMDPATTMKIIVFDRFGGPEVLQQRDVRVPVPGDGEVLVRNEAAGVNPVDFKIRAGKYPAVKEDKLPYVPGRDVSGTVVACGPSTQRFAKGDTVFAMPGIERGGYAEYVVVKESEAASRPKALDAVAAGAVPLAALTAWQGLFRHGELKEGQRVLIHGGSGGVGHFAIQFAKAKGARVATTVSGQRVAFARELGADQVIDYQTQRFENEVEEVDLVFDLVGGDAQQRSWRVLKRGGIMVSTLAEPSQQAAAERKARGTRYTVAESGADLAEIAGLIDAGKVKPVIAKTFPLAEAAAAQQYLEKSHPAGKVVLVVA